MPLPTFIGIKDKTDLTQFEDWYLDRRQRAVEAVRNALPALLYDCESMFVLRDNWRLASLHGMTEASLNGLHDKIIRTMAKHCVIRLSQINHRSSSFDIEFIFDGREIRDDLSHATREFRAVTDQKLAFISTLSSMPAEYRFSFSVSVKDGYDEELRFVSWTKNDRLPSVLNELSQKQNQVLKVVCDAFGPLWTVEEKKPQILDCLGESIAQVLRS